MGLNVWQTQVLGMVAIVAGSIFFGIIPACCCRRRSGERSQVSSVMLCLGAGVLFATSSQHMLPHSLKSLPNYGGPLYAVGFVLFFFMNEITDLIWGRAINLPKMSQSHPPATSHRINSTSELQQNENCIATGDDARAGNLSDEYLGHNPDSQVSYQNYTHSELRDQQYEPNLKNKYFHDGGVAAVHSSASSVPPLWSNENQALLSHEVHTEIDSNSNAIPWGLLVALTLHAILEGLAIGVQTEVLKVWLLVGAVALHKFVVGFCLGVELTRSTFSLSMHAFALILFAGASAVGIGIGMLIKQISQNWITVIPALNAVAAGSLLYVALIEVLPRERSKWQNFSERFWLFIFFVIGNLIIFIIKQYTEET